MSSRDKVYPKRHRHVSMETQCVLLYTGRLRRTSPIKGQQTETMSHASRGPMQRPYSRSALGMLEARWLVSWSRGARERVRDKISKVSGARKSRALQASARTLFFTLSEMGRRHGGSEPSRAKIRCPLAAMPRIDCRGRGRSREAVRWLLQAPDGR